MSSSVSQKKYALIGVTGYIAPRHLRAIEETGGTLKAAYGTRNNAEILASYFPVAHLFSDFKQFRSYLHNSFISRNGVDYLSICSPNHLHRSHAEIGLRAGSDIICEKPLVLKPSDVNQLAEIERETGKKTNTILQLRLHDTVRALRAKVAASPVGKIFDVDLGYFSGRDSSYHATWKGDISKSGGITTNIGVHYFDMLEFVFGPLKNSILHHNRTDAAAGYLEFEKARVRWIFSINREFLPSHLPAGQSTYRSITVDGEEIDFSHGFNDLHTKSYEEILAGRGFGLETVRASIELTSEIRNAEMRLRGGERHPLLPTIQR